MFLAGRPKREDVIQICVSKTSIGSNMERKMLQIEPAATPSHPFPQGVSKSDNYSHKLRAYTRRMTCCSLLVEI